MSSPADQGEPTEPEAEPDNEGERRAEPTTMAEAARAPRARGRRRVRTEAPPGSDPSPVREPERHDAGENDERLRADKPPHWA